MRSTKLKPIKIYTIRSQLILGSTVLFVVMLTIYFAFLHPLLRQIFLASEVEKISIYTESISTYFESNIQSAIDELETIATMDEIRSLDRERIDPVLTYLDNTSVFTLFFQVFDTSGTLISRPSKPERVGEDRSDREYIQGTLLEKQTFVSHLRVSPAGNLTLNIGTPIWDEKGDVSGVLVANLGLMDRNPQMYQAILEPDVPEGWQVFLVSDEGMLIAHSHQMIEAGGLQELDLSSHPSVKSALEGNWGLEVIELNGQRWYSNSVQISLTDWMVIVQIPEALIFQHVDKVSNLIALFVTIFLFVFLLGGVIAVSRSIGPLELLATSLGSYGETGKMEPLDVRGQDEISMALQAFNKMIADRQKAMEALRESELNYRTVADFTYDWEYWVYPDGSMSYVSPSCERISGYTADEFIRNPSLRIEIMTPETRKTWEEHKRLAYEEPGVHMTSFAIKRRDGEIRWIEHICQPVVGEDGTFLGMRASNRDISKRKQMEEDIRKMNEELEQRIADRTAELEAINQELKSFSYSISHDLRAPLRAINGFSEILQDEYKDALDENGKEYLFRVQNSARKMNTLIDDLLTLSRLGRKEMECMTIDLADIANQVFAEISEEIKDRKIDFQISSSFPVYADKGLMKIALTNLLSNAVKFTSNKKVAKIEFGAQEGDNGAEFYIKDNGIGFDMNIADKLFSPFQRMHSEDEFEGTGIGLAIVHRIIQRHGGKIWADSKPGKGTTFYFTLKANDTKN